MSSITAPHIIDSTNNIEIVEISDVSESQLLDILKSLGDENHIAYNYVLVKTIRLMEDLVGRPISDNVISFASKAAIHLSNRKWGHYTNSTARLELHLRAMSSVLHIFSQSGEGEHGPMIEANVRETLYKSVSKFWAIYRNTNYINANIMFSLREIRTCLRKIKDDQTQMNAAFNKASNVIDIALSVATKEYWSAIGSFVKFVDFEYTAGEWYLYWKEIREEYFKLRRECLERGELKNIVDFYEKLYEASIHEHEKVKRKNTKMRNFEYKVLKSGGRCIGSSLPDHVDTLLIGYLDLIQRLLMEFFTQLEETCVQKTISFCNEIHEAHVKKQLSFKAIEILSIIKEYSERDEIKYRIEMILMSSKNLHFTNHLQRNSTPPHFSSKSNGSQITPPATPTSNTSISSQEEKQKRRFSVRNVRNSMALGEVSTKLNFQKVRQLQTRKKIVDDVFKLLKERSKISKDIIEVEETHDTLSRDKHNSKEDIFSELKKMLEELKKEKEEKLSRSGSGQKSSEETNNTDRVTTIHHKYYNTITYVNHPSSFPTSPPEKNDNKKSELKEDLIEPERNEDDIDDGLIYDVFKEHEVKQMIDYQNTLDNEVKLISKESERKHVTEIIYENNENKDLKKDEKIEMDEEISGLCLETVEECYYEYLIFEQADKLLEHQNHLDNEIVFNIITVTVITKEENKPVEITTNQNDRYLQIDEEDYHFIIDEEFERYYIQDTIPKITMTLSDESDESEKLPYEPPPPYEELPSSKSSFEEFRTFLLNFHQVEPTDPLWKIEDFKEFEEMYKKSYKNTTQVQYINYINYVQQNNINQEESGEGFFAVVRKVVKEFENIVVKVSEGNRAANERLRRVSNNFDEKSREQILK